MKKKLLLSLTLFLISNFSYSQLRISNKEVTITKGQFSEITKSIEDFKIVEINLQALKSHFSEDKRSRVIWNLMDSINFDISLFPTKFLSPSFQQMLVSENDTVIKKLRDITTFAGISNEKYEARLTLDEDFIYGGIETANGMIMIDQLKFLLNDHTIPSNKIIIYNIRDLVEYNMECGTPETTEILNMNQKTEMFSNSSSSDCHIIDVAVDCDTEYWNKYGEDSFSRMLGEFNLIQNLYDEELNSILNITAIHAFVGNFYTSNISTTIIDEIDNLWSSSLYSNISRDLVHHFTGKNPGNYGRASGIGVLCNSNAVCYSVDRANVHQTVAHEIGHLLNGKHSEGSNCGTNYVRSIMCQGNNKDMKFSDTSISTITNYLNNNSCTATNSSYISGDNPICIGETETYSLENLKQTTGTSITWNLNNPKGIISAGQGTSTVTIEGVSNGMVQLSATIDYPGNLCSSVIINPIEISIGTPKPENFTSIIIDPYLGRIKATVEPVPGAISYKWYLDGILQSGTNSHITIPIMRNNCSKMDYIIGVKAVNECGTSAEFYEYHDNPCYTDFIYTFAPNPATNKIIFQRNSIPKTDADFISTDKENQSLAYYQIFNFEAQLIKEGKFVIENEIDVSELKKGRFFIKIISENQDSETHNLIIK